VMRYINIDMTLTLQYLPKLLLVDFQQVIDGARGCVPVRENQPDIISVVMNHGAYGRERAADCAAIGCHV